LSFDLSTEEEILTYKIWVPKNLKEKLPEFHYIPENQVGLIVLGENLGTVTGDALKLFKNPKSNVICVDLENYDWRLDAKLGKHLSTLSSAELEKLRDWLVYPEDFLYKIEYEEFNVHSPEVDESVSETRRLLASVLDNTWPEVWNVSGNDATRLIGLFPLENCSLYKGLTSNNRADLRGLCPNLWLHLQLFLRATESYRINNRLRLRLFAGWMKLASSLYGRKNFQGLRDFKIKNARYEYVGYDFNPTVEAEKIYRREFLRTETSKLIKQVERQN
jgi:hypothetical protein